MRSPRLASLLVALTAAGCGGGGGGGNGSPGPGGGNSLTATLAGQAWAADEFTVSVSGSSTPTRDGALLISGTRLSDGTTIVLSLAFMSGPATQPLGVNFASTPGGLGSAVYASKTYLTPLDGASGFVTFTVRTATRLAGTFHFTAVESPPGSATLSVTGGAFDITKAAGLPPLPTGVGSTVIATLGGTPWNAATIAGLGGGAGGFTFSAGNTSYLLALNPKVPVSAGNTYGIPSQVMLQVSRVDTIDAWTGGTGADVGTLTVTALTADRLVASFSGTLPHLSGGSALTVTGGAANVYLSAP